MARFRLEGKIGLPATGNIEKRPGNVRGFLGKQPQDGGSYFYRFSTSLHGYGSFDAFDTVRFSAAGMNVGGDNAGAHGVHPNALSCNLLSQANGQRVYRSFGRGIVNVFSRGAQDRGLLRHVYDCAAPASLPG